MEIDMTEHAYFAAGIAALGLLLELIIFFIVLHFYRTFGAKKVRPMDEL